MDREARNSLRVRPVAATDIGDVMALARAVGSGMTTLPADEAALARRIAQSIGSFADLGRGDAGRALGLFMLVLEDVPARRVVGTAAVLPGIGAGDGFFAFRRGRLHTRSPDLGVEVAADLLHLTNEHTGLTEVGMLCLLPEYRRHGVGSLLARSRYLLLAQFAGHFTDPIISELRGWQDADGVSPFWEAVGRPFFGMDFDRADRLSAVQGNRFIADLMPKHPIYVNLLPGAAQAAIGRPHDASLPAMRLLEREGFRYESCVDVFDAGPMLLARLADLATVRGSGLVRAGGPGNLPPVEALIATTDALRFAVTRGFLAPTEDGRADIDEVSRALLGLASGDLVRYAPV